MSKCLRYTIHNLLISFNLKPTDVDSSFNPQGSELSSAHQNQHSPVGKLPAELLIHIFCQCERGVESALILSHTCRHWRAVALNVGSLWTKVDIHVHPDSSTEQFNAFISFLGMQLDRTAQLPLEVFWQREGSDGRNGVIDDLIRRKGHFSRWRSLKARFEYHAEDAEPVFHPTDIFKNLEYLEILDPSHSHPVDSYEQPILHSIDRLVTSKFHTLNLRSSELQPEVFGKLYGNLMRYVRTLILSQKVFITEQLLTSITTLEVDSAIMHPLPHIQAYRLGTCFFTSEHPIDLQRLTSLTVDDVLILLSHTVLLLPSLQTLRFSAILLHERAEFKCPSLQSIHIPATDYLTLGENHLSRLRESINDPGFFLSPKRSLTIEQFIPSDIVIKLVELAPDVEYLSLLFDDRECALGVLKAVGRLMEESRSSFTQASEGHSRLVELRVGFFWDGCDMDIWVARVTDIMEKSHDGEEPTLMDVSKCRDDSHTIVLRRRDRLHIAHS
jgi:F-box-like